MIKYYEYAVDVFNMDTKEVGRWYIAAHSAWEAEQKAIYKAKDWGFLLIGQDYDVQVKQVRPLD